MYLSEHLLETQTLCRVFKMFNSPHSKRGADWVEDGCAFNYGIINFGCANRPIPLN